MQIKIHNSNKPLIMFLYLLMHFDFILKVVLSSSKKFKLVSLKKKSMTQLVSTSKRLSRELLAKEVFLESLEPFILDGLLDFVKPGVMQCFVEHFKEKGALESIESCIFHLDFSSLDIHQVGVLSLICNYFIFIKLWDVLMMMMMMMMMTTTTTMMIMIINVGFKVVALVQID